MHSSNQNKFNIQLWYEELKYFIINLILKLKL